MKKLYQFTWSTFLGVLYINCCRNMGLLGSQLYKTTQDRSFLAFPFYMLGIQFTGVSLWFEYLRLSYSAGFKCQYFLFRDIKGANILVDPNGEIKLADFGMAKHVSSSKIINLFLYHFLLKGVIELIPKLCLWLYLHTRIAGIWLTVGVCYTCYIIEEL